MRTLYESLLDDFDDLEKETDIKVSQLNTIGTDYRIDYIFDGNDFINHLNTDALKNSQLYWDRRDFTVNNLDKRMKPKKNAILLANIVLSLNLDFINKYSSARYKPIPKDHIFYKLIHNSLRDIQQREEIDDDDIDIRVKPIKKDFRYIIDINFDLWKISLILVKINK